MNQLSNPLIAKNLWVGIGCKRGSSGDLLHWAVLQALETYSLQQEAIAGLATLDRKAQEPGLVTLAAQWNLPLIAISPEILSQIPVPHPSRVVAQKVGTSSVAEAAAISAAMMSLGNFPPLLSGVLPDLLPKLFPKQVYRLANQPGVVSVAVAVALRSNIAVALRSNIAFNHPI